MADNVDPILTSLLKQVPALAALIWIVVQFLKHQEKTSAEFSRRIQTATESFGKKADECHDIQREAYAAVTKNAVTTEKLIGKIEQLVDKKQ